MLNFKLMSLIAILLLSITLAIFINTSSPVAPNPTYDKAARDALIDRINSPTPPGRVTPTVIPGNPPAPNPTYDKSALDAETDRITAHKPLGSTPPKYIIGH